MPRTTSPGTTRPSSTHPATTDPGTTGVPPIPGTTVKQPTTRPSSTYPVTTDPAEPQTPDAEMLALIGQIEAIINSGNVDVTTINLGSFGIVFSTSDINAVLASIKAGNYYGLTAEQVKAGLRYVLANINQSTGYYTITVKVSEGGELGADTAVSNNAITVRKGEEVNVFLTPDSRYVIKSLKIDGTAVPEAVDKPYYEYTFGNVTANHTVEVVFRPLSLLYKDNPAGTGYIITGTELDDEIVTIPERIDGKPVTGIGNGAFKGNTDLTAIILPSTVTYISSTSFVDCTFLTEITINGNVGNIEPGAFKGCDKLEKIIIDSNDVTYVDWGGLAGYGIDLISLGGNVTYINKALFKDCTWVTNIYISNSVTGIGSYAFSGCTGLKTVVIPASVTIIEEYAFYNCKFITNININYGTQVIKSYAFGGCTGLTTVVIPGSVTIIEEYAFIGCKFITNITINNGVQIIRDGAPNMYSID